MLVISSMSGVVKGQSGEDYGVAGPITEQLALGSIFWFIARGMELYPELEGSESGASNGLFIPSCRPRVSD